MIFTESFCKINSRKTLQKDLTDNELTRLLYHFTECGAQFVSKKAKSGVILLSIRIQDLIGLILHPACLFTAKKQILAIWKKLGYSMSSLDTRVQRNLIAIPLCGFRKKRQLLLCLQICRNVNVLLKIKKHRMCEPRRANEQEPRFL